MRVRLQLGALIFAVATALAAGVLLFGGTALGRPGDADCDATVSTVDAAMVLYYEAHLQELPCSQNADVDGDRLVNSRDAALILQFVAGLWFPTVRDSDCPPQGCPTRTPCPSGGCPTSTPVPPTPTSTPCPADGCPPITPTRTPCSPQGCPTRTPRPTPPDSVLGVEFSIAIDVDADGNDDCSTRDSSDNTCFVNEGMPFRLNVFLDRLPANLPQYPGFDIVARYLGLTRLGEPDAHVWPDCVFEAIAPPIPGLLAFGCVVGVGGKGEPGPLPSSSYTGIIGTAQFTSVCGEASISLRHGFGNTTILDEDAVSHLEARDGEETLIIACAFP